MSHKSPMLAFFSYFGSKVAAARHYPQPRYNHIIEPFAGAAGYSLRYPHYDVCLYDINEKICGVWDYLIRTSPEEIRRLPVGMNSTEGLQICEEAKWLIGFWFCRAGTSPRKQMSDWMERENEDNILWSEITRARIANQVKYIKHWKIKCMSYENISNTEACWYVDPPYQQAGKSYKYHDINYRRLGEWCKEREGQVIACENEGADWLPFRKFIQISSNPNNKGKKPSIEVIWTKGEKKGIFS